MSLEMLADLVAGVPDIVRFGIAAVTTLVLGWWTYRRAAGDGTDPSISVSGGGQTGSASFLVSGVVAVAFVAGVWVLGLGPEIQAKPALLLIPGAFVVAHWFVEARES